MTIPEITDLDYDEADDECWQCSGEGGWNSCIEDCCPAIGGEEWCDDPACWRRCDVCQGKGHLRAGGKAAG